MSHHGTPATHWTRQAEQGTFHLVDAEASRRPNAGTNSLDLARWSLQHQPQIYMRMRLLHSEGSQDVAGVLLVDVGGVQVGDDHHEVRLAHSQPLHVLVPRRIAHEVVRSSPGMPGQRSDGLPKLAGLVSGGHKGDVRPPEAGVFCPVFVAEDFVQKTLEDGGAPSDATADYDDVRVALVRLPLALTRALQLMQLHQVAHLGGEEAHSHDDGHDNEKPRQRSGR
mmetsp:Transcript_10691/g.29980  ORF Transcript_10691/g.29980 Transcript_10691/m.29980 type:complete len:224 (+) Transcript_10691:1574-2245(+)